MKYSRPKAQLKIWDSIRNLLNASLADHKVELEAQLEEILLGADMGYSASKRLTKEVSRKCNLKSNNPLEEMRHILSQELLTIIRPLEKPLMFKKHQSMVLFLVGVNGSGKTTTCAKLANHIKRKNLSVLLGAADTFRAAGIEQISSWGDKLSIEVVKNNKRDPASIAYQAIQTSLDKQIDVTLIDTAGRLPNQNNLMQELAKMRKVINKANPDAIVETLLTIDSNLGQNNINQVTVFDGSVGLDGIILTKLDGSAKGGSIVALAQEKSIPIRFIGTGENIEDLQVFEADKFVSTLLQ